MDLLVVALVVIITSYPYFLLIRFLRLGCKAFKKYLFEQPIYEDYDEE